MKFNRLIMLILLLFFPFFASANCIMETSGMVDIYSGSWIIEDVNGIEILSDLGASDSIINDLNSGVSGYTFYSGSVNPDTLYAEGSDLDPTTWTLISSDGRIDAFSGSCSTLSSGEVVISAEDYNLLNIFEIAFFLVAGLFTSILFIIKQI